MRAVTVTRSVYLAAPPERVWPLLADTDRFNRINGSTEVHYRPTEEGDPSGARFVAETRAGGFKLVYEELPFEWSHQKAFGVHRRMRGGPIESYTWRVTLAPTKASDGEGALEGGTRATLRFDIVPRVALLRPVAWLNASRFAARFIEVAHEVDAHVSQGSPSPFRQPVSPSDAARLDAAIERLRKDGVDAALAERLARMVRDAPDADVVRIRPFELATEWSVPPRDALRAFLKSVPAGLFELRWGLICPSCLTASEQVESLAEISADGHCQLCDITFGLDLDRAVEATFRPHPSVRRVPDAMFCIGGPARTPHVLVQALAPAGSPVRLDVPAAPGRYRVFVRGGATATLEVSEGGEEAASVTLSPGGLEPTHLRAAPGGALQLENRCADARHVKIERLEFASRAATAHEISTLEEFRTLFSRELLKRETPLKVARAALLFSDLTGSTALYTHVGDAAAFRLVDDHFDVLRAVISAHDGVLIKTMGDAVMAAFVDVGACARAALDALRRFEEFRAKAPNGAHVGLKVGLYAGPCYVVTANGALDYFGQTVNVASRVQHLASSAQVVLPHDALALLPDDERAALTVLERFEARVKGVDEPLDLVRVGLGSASGA